MSLAPILLFTYNRLDHTRRTVEALLRNDLAAESELIVYSDGSADTASEQRVEQVRSYLVTITGFKHVAINLRPENCGLGKNIIEGVNREIDRYGKVIVMEDDLITSPHFLRYMNEGLALYEKEPEVISIHGYTYPVDISLPETFFIKNADCLGWGTWKRGWDLFEKDGSLLLAEIMKRSLTHRFDFDGAYPFTRMLKDQIAGRNSSWAIRWYATAFLNGKFTLYPGRSLVYHAGNDGSGTNTGVDSVLNVNLSREPVVVKKQAVVQDEAAYEAIGRVYRRLSRSSLMDRLKSKLRRVLSLKTSAV